MSRTLHNPSTGTTAVLVFARTLEREGRERFGDIAPARRSLMLHGLRAQLTSALAGARLPVIYSSERDQRGGSFGERLQEASTRVFAQGFKHLIVVGGDCPGLRSSHLQAAAQALASGQTVIGRDLRGGVYLMGLSAAEAVDTTFAALPFQTPVMAKALCTFLYERGGQAPLELVSLGDLHGCADLLRQRQKLLTPWLQRLVRSLRTIAEALPALLVPRVSNVWAMSSGSHRGPPCAFVA